MAEKIFENYHRENCTGRYGEVEKALILDYVELKQREQRERESRHQSDLANIERTSVLKEQVKVLKEQVSVLRDQFYELKEQVSVQKAVAASNSKDTKRANRYSFIAIVISALSLIATITIELAKLNG